MLFCICTFSQYVFFVGFEGENRCENVNPDDFQKSKHIFYFYCLESLAISIIK